MLKVIDLRTYFFTRRSIIKAVNGINFNLERGECLCIVGESGCGKSVTALSILRLFDSPPGKIVSGEIIYKNKNLINLSVSELRRLRGSEISMIFQDAQSALNPVFTIGEQIVEQIRIHGKASKKEAKDIAIDLLHKMGIPDPMRAFASYPHQLSGGMRQRAMIAMALSCDPEILIADEPTTAVDVTIKVQILDLLQELQLARRMSILFITHDFSTVSQIGNRALIVYSGEDVEYGMVDEIMSQPLHPYTVSLLNCLPGLSGESKLYSIKGSPPDPSNLPSGCTFHPRCEHVMEICSREKPIRKEISRNRFIKCHLFN